MQFCIDKLQKGLYNECVIRDDVNCHLFFFVVAAMCTDAVIHIMGRICQNQYKPKERETLALTRTAV